MKKDLGVQPYVLPMPVLIVGTYNEDGSADAMNAAWGTLCEMNVVALYLSAEHKTTENIRAKKAFTVSIADEAHLIACDYVGLVSAHNEKNKMQKAGFTVRKSAHVDAPVIEELPLTLECKLVRIDEDTGCVLGEIVNVSADERVLDERGKADITKIRPLTYDPIRHGYYALGEQAGKAFSSGAKLK